MFWQHFYRDSSNICGTTHPFGKLNPKSSVTNLITEGCLWYIFLTQMVHPLTTKGYNSNNHELMLINIGGRQTHTHLFNWKWHSLLKKNLTQLHSMKKIKELWSIRFFIYHVRSSKVYNSHNRTIRRQLNVSAIPLNSNKLEPKKWLSTYNICESPPKIRDPQWL